MRTAIAAALLALGAAAWAAPSQAAELQGRALAGVWWTTAYQPRLVPIAARPLPFTPQGRSLYAKTAAGLKSGAVIDLAERHCVPEGMPRAMTSAYPFQIMMTPGQITFAHEVNRAYRTVAFTDRHADPKVWDPSYMGDGIARWDGDTLVIDSTNFKAAKIYLDASGLPASDKLHLVERVRLTDGGRVLEDLITVEDPVIFTGPWSARLTFARRDDIRVRPDWVCGERHRDVSKLMGRAAK
jgi:hypothetical protein